MTTNGHNRDNYYLNFILKNSPRPFEYVVNIDDWKRVSERFQRDQLPDQLIVFREIENGEKRIDPPKPRQDFTDHSEPVEEIMQAIDKVDAYKAVKDKLIDDPKAKALFEFLRLRSSNHLSWATRLIYLSSPRSYAD